MNGTGIRDGGGTMDKDGWCRSDGTQGWQSGGGKQEGGKKTGRRYYSDTTIYVTAQTEDLSWRYEG